MSIAIDDGSYAGRLNCPIAILSQEVSDDVPTNHRALKCDSVLVHLHDSL